jgi:hypothetical protein
MEYQKVVLNRAVQRLRPLLAHLNGDFDWEREYEWAVAHFGEELMADYGPEDYRRGEEILRAQLKTFVDSWMSAGFNASEWFLRNPDLFQALRDAINSRQRSLEISPEGHLKIVSVPQARWFRRYYLNEAAWLFGGLVAGPLADAIGKCERCGRYFLKVSNYKNKKYCSRKCATNFTALKSTKERRDKERQDKVQRVNQAMKEFIRLSPDNTNWKSWVAERAEVTQKWLTQAINRSDLKVPKSLRSR